MSDWTEKDKACLEIVMGMPVTKRPKRGPRIPTPTVEQIKYARAIIAAYGLGRREPR